MKKAIKVIITAILAVTLIVSLCSCLKIKKTVVGWFNTAKDAAEDADVDKTGQELFAGDDGAKNRESRIEGAIAKARNSQMEYNESRMLDGGLDVQPDGTVYVVEANGYYIAFIVKGGELVDVNPEVLPTEDPYKNNKDYKKATKYADKIRKDCTIYLPKGEN